MNQGGDETSKATVRVVTRTEVSPEPAKEKQEKRDSCVSASQCESLPTGTLLGPYRLEAVLGRGGFGITYLGVHTQLYQKVAIKEYLPVQLACRDGHEFSVHPRSEDGRKAFERFRDSFLEEARTIARLQHPNMVRILGFLEALNTAYMVMEFEPGESLATILKREKTLSYQRLLELLTPLLDGLNALHFEGFIHRDIKPANILIRARDGSPVILDFGSARRMANVDGGKESMTTLLSPGYAPPEQYAEEARSQGPWSDIYALSAVLYHAVGGLRPSDSLKRSHAIVEGGVDPLPPARVIGEGRYPLAFLNAIDWGLKLPSAERPCGIEEWRAALDQETTTQVDVQPLDQSRRRWLLVSLLSMVAVLIMALTITGPWMGHSPHEGGIPSAQDAPGLPSPSGDPVNSNPLLSESSHSDSGTAGAWEPEKSGTIARQQPIDESPDAVLLHGAGAKGMDATVNSGGSRAQSALQWTVRVTSSLGSREIEYREGEQIRFLLSTNRDAHLYLFNINAQGTVTQLHPPPGQPDLLQPQGSILGIPEDGNELVAGPPFGKDEVWLVATPAPLQLPDEGNHRWADRNAFQEFVRNSAAVTGLSEDTMYMVTRSK